jgi:hypothetical protein
VNSKRGSLNDYETAVIEDQDESVRISLRKEREAKFGAIPQKSLSGIASGTRAAARMAASASAKLFDKLHNSLRESTVR